MFRKYGVVDGAKYTKEHDIPDMYLDNVWYPNLSVTGADGLPPIASAGNVVRSSTSVRLSMRLCPAMNAKEGEKIIIQKLTENVPYNAKVTLGMGHAGNGWSMKELQPWLTQSIKEAGAMFYDGKPAGSYGMGGSIPFLS